MPNNETRLVKKKVEEDDNSSSSDSDDDSDFSDADYELSSEDLQKLASYGVSDERLNKMWNDQSGLCVVSGFPLVIDSNSENLYMAEVAPRRVTEPVSDLNSVLVSRVMNIMREPTGLSWSRFSALLQRMDRS